MSSIRFHEILKELGDLHDKKQKDYGTAADPFANVHAAIRWGVQPWVAALVRASDKMQRLQTLAATGSLSNEGAEDSFRDLAVYAIIALILWEEEEHHHHGDEVLPTIINLKEEELAFDDEQCPTCGVFMLPGGGHLCLSSR